MGVTPRNITATVYRQYYPPGHEMMIYGEHQDASKVYVARIVWEECEQFAKAEPTLHLPNGTHQQLFSRLAGNLVELGFIHTRDSERVAKAKDDHIKSLEDQVENLRLTIAWMAETITNLKASSTRVVYDKPELGDSPFHIQELLSDDVE